MKSVWCVIIPLLLSGCATQVPTAISKSTASDINLAEVIAQPERFTGSEVRWGGMIAKVENKSTKTWVEVVSRELKNNGEPLEESRSSGRFIASINGFVDPYIYSTGRLITVVGTIDGHTTRLIGGYDYLFPIVEVTAFYLWPVKREPVYQDYPPPWWYYDPWLFYPYPYYYPYPYRRHK